MYRLLIICCFFLALPPAVTAQRLVPDSNRVDPGLQSRIKTQKTMFRVTSVAGAALAAAGGMMFLSEMGKSAAEYNETVSRTGETLFYAGAALVVVSIPLKIAWRRNEKLAASVSPGVGRLPGTPLHTAAANYPYLSIRVRL